MYNLTDDTKIDVTIGANFFAPKCADRDLNFDTRNSHAIASSACNFLCSFCKHGLKETKANLESFGDYKKKVIKLMEQGRMFKFTGGEPCVNPHLPEMIKVVKEIGGTVFLDTNGSMLNIIKDLLDKNLIDVLGVSLKGLNREEAMETAGINNCSLCWDNVLETIRIASRCENVRVIVTYVAYDDFNYTKLCNFASILENINDNIFLKINNLCGNNHRNMYLKALNKDILPKMLFEFSEKNPKWKDRIILINSSEGVTDYNKIMFF